ncbi:Cytochrome c oxidase subunit 4 [Ceratobasidium sp. 395]|nr:Cytochrome c oxidase subunit 4 [Ceratobasidium sp. 395]
MLAAVRNQLRPAARAFRPFPRTLHTTTRVFAGHAPPSLLGEGAKPGEVPTDENQSTGLERLEILGKLEGIDVFDMNPLEMTRMGTLSDPIKIYSLASERHVGCTGYPADSHDTIWLTVNQKLKNHRCPECGCVYTLDFHGDPHAHEHH